MMCFWVVYFTPFFHWLLLAPCKVENKLMKRMEGKHTTQKYILLEKASELKQVELEQVDCTMINSVLWFWFQLKNAEKGLSRRAGQVSAAAVSARF